ncbi:trans-sulfuration enzyme family protein [Aureibacter tunicatorum]|uniref:O-succinylhomoserine sulfhydrylase n=1 Tax=Aureibacter tunicatorum TaxID=866807 RepID=A0AAE4BVD0_9BACT|nr:aminotransferase class I/II-fold pyridoxal phosphate-dependent enzyme [Aureibacter tunicatorum]MDR6241633.1 O-succinylhomoserine sulfhydrylase [Aureibacter tunicatorum]BDD07251.1 O-succinylhomoserine sulfhydrylase [Aureibacter tunicatorum]
MRIETDAIRTQTERTQHKEHSVPVFMTSSFIFDDAEHARALFEQEVDGNIYSRYSNPNNDELVAKLCAFEHTDDGLTTASGMAAIFSSLAGLLESGDHILSCRSVFGSTHQLLTQVFPKWGITHTYVPIEDTDSWEQEIKENTKVILIETPSNPALDVLDLEKIGDLAKKHGLVLIVDNCFASPYLQQPADFGAHIITHSATKFLDGQGRTIGGVILGQKDLIEKIRFFARHSGPSLSPFNAWLVSKSLETLPVRMDRHCDNALKIAEFLESHPMVEKVKYPFLPSHPQYDLARKQMKKGGGLVTFYIKGGLAEGKTFLDAIKIGSLTANLGDTRTTITHPASTTHSKLSEDERLQVGITSNLVRISAGLENVEDIIEDLNQALAAVESSSK